MLSICVKNVIQAGFMVDMILRIIYIKHLIETEFRTKSDMWKASTKKTAASLEAHIGMELGGKD